MSTHDDIVETFEFIIPITLIKNIYPSYLPLVNGIGHTWDVFFYDIVIGIIKVNDDVISKIPEVIYNKNNNKMFFKYHSASY